MNGNMVEKSQAMVANALKQNPQFIETALDLYKQIMGDIRDYIHGPLQANEFKTRMAGYGKAIAQWRNFLATIQMASQIKDIDELMNEIPKLNKK